VTVNGLDNCCAGNAKMQQLLLSTEITEPHMGCSTHCQQLPAGD
jgi:hypothetical protein